MWANGNLNHVLHKCVSVCVWTSGNVHGSLVLLSKKKRSFVACSVDWRKGREEKSFFFVKKHQVTVCLQNLWCIKIWIEIKVGNASINGTTARLLPNTFPCVSRRVKWSIIGEPQKVDYHPNHPFITHYRKKDLVSSPLLPKFPALRLMNDRVNWKEQRVRKIIFFAILLQEYEKKTSVLTEKSI